MCLSKVSPSKNVLFRPRALGSKRSSFPTSLSDTFSRAVSHFILQSKPSTNPRVSPVPFALRNGVVLYAVSGKTWTRSLVLYILPLLRLCCTLLFSEAPGDLHPRCPAAFSSAFVSQASVSSPPFSLFRCFASSCWYPFFLFFFFFFFYAPVFLPPPSRIFDRFDHRGCSHASAHGRVRCPSR